MWGRNEQPARLVRAEVDHGHAELIGDPDRAKGWTLLVGGTAQSHVDLPGTSWTFMIIPTRLARGRCSC